MAGRSLAILDPNGRPFPKTRQRLVASWERRPTPSAYVPYEAASQARERHGWNPTLASADATLLPHLWLMRARSRDAARNGIGAGVVRTLVDYIVGKRGLVRQSRIDPELFGGNEDVARQAERQIEAAHRRRTRRVDTASRLSWASMQRLACRTWIKDGDVIGNLVLERDNTLRIELIDADRLDTPPGKSVADGIRLGVELDANDVPVAYHFSKRHPNDYGNIQKQEWVRVPRWNAVGRLNILHCFEHLDVSQTRGAPFLSPALDRCDDNGEFVKYKLFQARGDAMRSYWVKTEGGAYADEVAAGEETDRGTPIEDVESGSVNYLKPGEDVVIPEPTRPGTETQVFRDTIHGEIAASTGLTIELISKDFSKTTWHAARQSSLEVTRTVGALQTMLIEQFVEPFDDMVCEDAILAGEVPLIPPSLYQTDPVGFLGHRYQVPVRGLVDPGQENDASVTAVEAGMSSLEDECATRGKDWQDVIDQKAREQAYAKSKGVTLGKPAPTPPMGEAKSIDDDREAPEDAPEEMEDEMEDMDE